MTDPNLPGLHSLRALLAPYVGKRARTISMKDRKGRALGNNGDHLMLAVFQSILSEFDIEFSDVLAEPDVIIVPPNGALLETYSFPLLLKERLVGFERIPLVIFPSSAYFPKKSPAFIFEGRTSDTLWILRERASFAHLESLWGRDLDASGVRLALDHDVVASGHQFVPAIIGESAASNTTLVAGRCDREASSLDDQISNVMKGGSAGRFINIAKWVLAAATWPRLGTMIARNLRAAKLRAAGERLLKQAQCAGYFPNSRSGVVFVDASATQFMTFNEYREAIRTSELIITDRLHVALPGVILGKRVVMVEAGYHKLGGVYNQSLTGCRNVVLVEK